MQLYQKLLCVPFNVFHKAITEVLDRPVFTHEFAWLEELQDEFEGKKPKSPPEEVMGYLDPSTTIVVKALPEDDIEEARRVIG